MVVWAPFYHVEDVPTEAGPWLRRGGGRGHDLWSRPPVPQHATAGGLSHGPRGAATGAALSLSLSSWGTDLLYDNSCMPGGLVSSPGLSPIRLALVTASPRTDPLEADLGVSVLMQVIY